MPELTRRQEEILSCIVRAYTDSPEPISSRYLVEKFNLSLSSATVRNEMAVLEDLGYIAAPHTSAGRIPTETGYRYFVKRLITAGEISSVEKSRISDRLKSIPLASEQWMLLAATMLARTSHVAALVTPPVAETSRFKHLELIAIQGRLVLMVLVLQGGAVHQQMLNLAEPLTQPRISETAERINALCMDLSAKEVRMRSVQMQHLDQEISELVADLMEKADSNQVRLVYRNGLSEVLGKFTTEGAQQAVRVFDEWALLNLVLNDVLTPMVNNVQVVVAGNGRWEQLSHLSLVLSRYGIPGQISGAVGVLGPTRIDYGRAISAVGYVSSLMTDLLTDGYDELPAGESESEE